MSSLSKHHTAKPASRRGFLLLHSTGSKPANSEVNGPLIYADYCFLEASLRRKNFGTANNLSRC